MKLFGKREPITYSCSYEEYREARIILEDWWKLDEAYINGLKQREYDKAYLELEIVRNEFLRETQS